MLRRLALPLAAVALAAAGCGGEETTGFEGASPSNGKRLFVSGTEGNPSCGSCHTLADAATVANVGPNLDQALGYACAGGFEDDTLFSVVLGQIDLAAPPMPADLVTGQDAVDVAAYVATVAGQGVEGCDRGSGGGATTGATETTTR